jgi:glycosyltransferase involved in cell wall biosynthesis
MVSVVIPTYNRKEPLMETLKAFSKQTFKDFEVVIIDDGSSDGTKEAIDKNNFPFEIRYFFQGNKGPAAARNRGIREAKNEIILFTDADIIPGPELLAEHLESHKKGGENLAVLGYMEWDPRIKLTPFRKYIADYHLAYPRIKDENNVEFGFFYTGNISVYKKFLIQTGFFDETFPHAAYEDTEFSYRLHKSGMRIILNRKAFAYHNHPIDFKSYQKTVVCRGESTVVLAQKVPSLKRKASYNETKNPVRYFFKKLILNDISVSFLVEAICFLDKLMIPLPKICYAKIMDYHRIKGIKQAKNK